MQLFANKGAVSSPITTMHSSAFQILLGKPAFLFALMAVFSFQISAGDTINFDSYTAGAALDGQDGWVWHDISVPDNANDMKSITFSGSDNVAACTTYGVGEHSRPLISRSSIAELRWKWRTDATTAKGAFGPCSTMSESGGSWNAFRVRPTIDGSGNFNCKGAAFVNATTVAGWPKYGLNKWYYMRLYMNMTTNKYSLYLDSVSFAGTTETQLVNDSTMAHTAGLAVSKVGFKGNTGVGGKIYIDSIMWSDPWVASSKSVDLTAVADGVTAAGKSQSNVWLGTAIFTPSGSGSNPTLQSVTVTVVDNLAISEMSNLSSIRLFYDTDNTPSTADNSYGSPTTFSSNTSGTATFTANLTVDGTKYLHLFANTGSSIEDKGVLKPRFAFTASSKGTGDPTTASTGTQFSNPSGMILAKPVLYRIQRGTLTFNTADTSITILGVDTTRSFLVFSTSTNDANPDNVLVGGELNQSSVKFHKIAAGVSSPVEWQVFEFSSGVRVAHGQTLITSNPQKVYLGSMFDLSRSFPLATAKKVGAGFDNDDGFQPDLVAGDSLFLKQQQSSTNATSYWQVVQYDSCNVQKWTQTLSAGSTSATKAIVGVNTTKSIALSWHTQSGLIEPDDLPRTELTSSAIQLTRTGTEMSYYFLGYVVTFTDETAVKHFSATMTGLDSKIFYSGALDTAISGIFGPGNFGRQGNGGANNGDDNPGAAWYTYKFKGTDSVTVTRTVSTADAAVAPFQVVTFPYSGAKIWTGASNSSWNTAGNWSPIGEPSATDSVLFNTGSAACNLDVNRTVKTIQFTSGYNGIFTFNASCSLSVTGAVTDFRSGADIVTNSASALQMTGTSAQALFPRSSDTLPMLIQNGSGGTTSISSNPLHCSGPLVIKNGTFNLNNLKTTCAGLSATGGTLNGASDTLLITGNANFTNLTFNAETGFVTMYVVSAADGEHYTFTHAGKTFNNLRLHGARTGGGYGATHLYVSAGTLTVGGNLILYSQGRNNCQERIDFAANDPTVNVAGRLVASNNGTDRGFIYMGDGTWTVGGDADFSGITQSQADNGLKCNGSTLVLNKSSGTQVLSPVNGTANVGNYEFNAVTHTGAGTLQLSSSPLNSATFLNSAGVLDFNGFDVTTTGDFEIFSGTNATLVNLGGRTITAGDDARFVGQNTSLLNLNPSTAWNVGAADELVAHYADLNNCTATNKPGRASATCSGTAGLNPNWIFNTAGDYRYLRFAATGISNASFTARPNELRWKSGDIRFPVPEMTSNLLPSPLAVSATADDANSFKLYDDNTSTYWSVGSTPSSATVDLGSFVNGWITPDSLYFVGSTEDARKITAFSCEGSSDGVSWDMLLDTTGVSIGTAVMFPLHPPSACIPPSVTSSPANASVTAGQQASFTVAGNGTPTLLYQWERSNDAGATWAAITGENAATYVFTTASADNGAQFRAVVTSDAVCTAPATSAAATLTVCTPPSVATNPSSASVTAGQQASFTVAGSGTPTLLYQWERSNDAGANWAAITGENAATYAFTTASADNGAQFRAVVTSDAVCTAPATSAAATLTVCTPQSISSHPASQSKIAGETATFTVGASGTGIFSYLWERSNDAGTTWSTITSATTPTYDYTALRTDSDPLFRATVSSNSSCNTPVTSNSALLSVCAPPIIDIDPSTQDVIAGSTASFTVSANGTGLTYKWQSTRSGAWADESGQTGATFAFASALTDSGDSVRAIVTGNCGSVTSAIAFIIVRTQCIAPTITAQPATQTAITSGTNALFTIGASGTSPLYQWATNGSGSWQNIAGANLASYQVAASAANDGHWFRAVVTGASCGTAQQSDSAQLTVCYPPSVSNPTLESVPENQPATFIVSGSGSPILTYAWQRSNDLGSTWTPIAGITTASYTIATTQTSDSGAQFRAIVSSTSPCGAPPATSASATLSVTTVTTVPVISLEPRDTTAADGMPVSFTVAATGTIPLTYRWLQDGTDSVGSDPTLSIVAEKADSGHYVICIIRNVAGADTSRKAYLHVGAAYSAPVITIHPLGKNVFEGQPVSFTVAATGNPSPTYQWVKNGTPVTGATAETLSIAAALVSDNNARIMCLVSNSLSPQGISSDTVTLIVESKPTARFFAKPELGDAPLQVTFTDSSTGIVFSRTWYFGDNTTDTSRNPVHVYANPGQYTVSLKVSNPGGMDSLTRQDLIWAYTPGSNKARLTGRYLLNDKVEITITNLRALTYAFPPPWTDSMGIWFAPGAAPTSLALATRLRVYPKATLEIRDTLIDTLTVSTADSIAGFSSAIYRNDRSLSTVSPGNSFSVLLRDTIRPVNALALSGVYIGGDTASIILDSTGSIDTARIDSICIWFDRSGTAPDFGSAKATWISAAQIAASDKYTHRVISPLFSGEQKQIVCAVIQKGKNGLLSPLKTATFTVGKARPVNTVRLRAEAIGATRIQLSWNQIEGISHIRIWKGITPVPSDNVPVTSFDTLPVRTSDTTFIVTGLNPTTRYYFGAQILRDGQWSDIPDSAKANAQTPEPSDTTRIPNVAVLTSLTFDTLSATIQVGWRIDTTAFQNLELGIAYAHRGYPLDALDPQILTLSERSGTTTLRTKGDIRFDTTYFINLWLRKPEGIWAVPSDSGYDTLRTPKFTRQIVSFFSAQRDYDTVSAFNGTVILSKGPEFPKMNQSTDTIVAYRMSTAPPGMVTVGTGFTFSKKEPTAPFTIGLAYTPIPTGYSVSQIRMYRDSAGVLLLEHSSTIDSVHRLVTITTSNLEFPFLLMIDTQKPVFEFMSNIAGIVDAASDLKDTVVLSDNIGNLHWSFLYSRGDEPPVIQQGTTGYLHALRDTLQLLVPSSSRAISQDFGLRALLIISDGVHVDTINCSRQVYRDRSDEVTTVQQQWYPLSVTAQLTHVRPESLLTTMVGKDSTWKYDNRYFRLFRWVTTPDNETADKRWVEYSEQVLPLFSFTPGRLIWIKTRENKQISFGKGVTLSLKDTALIPLATGDWTDIALPYRFSIMLGDILDATGKIGDSLIVYSWHKDSTSKKFTTAPLFAAEFPDRRDRAVVMNYKAGTGFTIYNPLGSEVTLRVPPTPVSMSKILQQSTPKRMRTDSWSTKVITRTTAGDAMPDVYCGYTPGAGKPVFYPSPPTFLSTRVMVYDRAGQRRYGHCMRHGAVDGAYVYEIAFVNESDKPENFRYNLATTGDVPDKIEPLILDPTAKTWAQGGNITVAAHTVELRWLVASDQDYRDRFSSGIGSWKYALQLVYPNPFHSFVHARYLVPAASEGTVRFTIHDVLGREVWHRELRSAANAGPGTITWDGRNNSKRKVSAGSYIFRMLVVDKQGRKVHSFNTRLTYIPK